MKKFHETKTLFSFRYYGVQINCSNFSCGKKGKLPIKTEIRPSSNDNLAESSVYDISFKLRMQACINSLTIFF